MPSTVTPATKTSVRTAHPQHPAPTFSSADSGSILSIHTPGKVAPKLTTGTQTGGTKEGEVFSDFA